MPDKNMTTSEQLRFNTGISSEKNGTNLPIIPLENNSFRSERFIKALNHAVTYPAAPGGKISEDQVDALERVNYYAGINESRIRLRDFNFPKSTDEILERLEKSSFLPTTHPDFDSFINTARKVEDRHFWTSEKGKELLDDADELVFEKIQKEFKLSTQREAKRFFRGRVKDANGTVTNLVRTKLESLTGTESLLNNTSFITSPAKMVAAIVAPDSQVTDRLRYEYLRTLTLAELSAKVEKKSETLSGTIEDFQFAIDDTVFDHGQKLGAGENVTIYTFYDPQRGIPLWISQTDDPLTQDQIKDYEKKAVLKKTNLHVRDAGEEIGRVYTNPREKGLDQSLEKMVRRAEKRMKLVGDDFVEPGSLTDLGGLLNILIDEHTNNGTQVQALINKHKDILKTRFGVTDEGIKEKDEKSTTDGLSSEGHTFRRLKVTLPDGNIIEEIFVSLPAHLRNEHEIGEPDPVTGILNGPAHKLYEERRWIAAARSWFPPEIYGPIDWDSLLKDRVNSTAEKIRLDGVIAVNSLPEEYVVFHSSSKPNLANVE